MSEWNEATAEWYAGRYGEYATNRLGVDALTLRPDSVVVDVGCGTGAALRHAASTIVAGRLIGVDPVPRMVEIARERLAGHPARDRIELRVGSAEALPLEDDLADTVLAFDSFDHWRDVDAGLAEVRRVLRDDGSFVVVKDGGLPGGAAGVRRFLGRLAAAGFEVVDERAVVEAEVAFTLWQLRCARRAVDVQSSGGRRR